METIPAYPDRADVGGDDSEAMMQQSNPESHAPDKWQQFKAALRAFDEDESGVAMTEYIIVFSAITFGATLALISATVFVKAYRDFLVWWLAHPAV